MRILPYILIVEDDRPIADAMRSLLESEGFEVRVAPEGDSALSECERQQPACIVLDYNMPVMDGGALIEELRWRPHLSSIPIVLTSAMRDLDVVARRLQIPYVLPKPFDAEHAAQLVRRAIDDAGRLAH
jgi:two-component system nitrogen regulation response regulator GlnG